MGRGGVPTLRAIPRAFVPGLPDPLTEAFEVPKEEWKKFHNVLRLSSGDQVAILPNDGRLIRCELQGHEAIPLETLRPQTESALHLRVALGLPKPDKLEESVRMGSELGVNEFWLFPAERSVVRWEASKFEAKLKRLESIAREACEVSFRVRLPEFRVFASLAKLLEADPNAVVMSESDQGLPPLAAPSGPVTVVIGPEGGWAPREVALIGDRAVTLGPRVLRVDTAVAATCSLLLCGSPSAPVSG